MPEHGTTERYPYIFIALYTLIYMGNAVFNTFFPVYLDHAGFGRTAIGTLMALGPLVAITAQPVWGMAGDRAETKNAVLRAMVLGSGLTILLFPLSVHYYYLFVIISVFTFFQTGMPPISDAITLEYLEKSKWKFGPIRMSGTIGYALMAVAAGIVTKANIGMIFFLYAGICLLLLFSTVFLPKIKGHQFKGNKVSIGHLFKNRELVLLMGFNLAIQTALAYYYSFFSIYLRSLGADNSLLGWAQFIAAVSEIPFLLFADKIISRLGTRLTMVLSALLFSIRCLLFSLITDIHAILFINLLHGSSFIVLQYCLAVYINRNVPRELKASGQTMNTLIGFGASRILGSILGGFLSDQFGMRLTFMIDSAFVFLCMLLFGGVFLKNARTKKAAGEGVD